jgi:hypothetical protein
VPRLRPPSPAGPRRGETVREWYFGLGGPARYRVVIDDGAVPGATTVWAMSPGEALDAVLVNVDARKKINVRGSPARVEEIGREPEAEDVKATDAGWRFGPPERLPRFDRQDVADSVIFIALLGIAGAVIGAYAFAVFSLLHGNWVRAAVAGVIATVPAAGLALAWLRA